MKSNGWICNTVEEMEIVGLNLLRNYLQLPVRTVGPLQPPTSHFAKLQLRQGGGCSKEKSRYPPRMSVFVVNIDSRVRTSTHQQSPTDFKLLDHPPKTTTFSVIDYGAVGDGHTDDSKAFLKAWGAACALKNSIGTVQVPRGKTFLLNPVSFTGPCQFSSINFMLEGDLIAPKSTEAWTKEQDHTRWIEFVGVNGLVVNGGGQINGRGSIWWKAKSKNGQRPVALSFKKCNNLQLSGTRHLNSAKGHISVSKGHHITLSNLDITAPKDSLNTDGIDISIANYIVIQNSIIGTGDDCISMGNGISNIRITNIACGPGHGISVGSLGKNGLYATVENVYVGNCNFNGTTNGVRIKTWQMGSGYVRNVTFEHIKLISTKNPIIINQNYENILANKVKDKGTGGLKISGITYRDVKGTSATKIAIALDCSSIKECNNIIMEDIKLTPVHPTLRAPTASCKNVHGDATSVVPKVPCLSNKQTN